MPSCLSAPDPGPGTSPTHWTWQGAWQKPGCMSSPDGAQGSMPPSVGGFVLESDSAGKPNIQEQEEGTHFQGSCALQAPSTFSGYRAHLLRHVLRSHSILLLTAVRKPQDPAEPPHVLSGLLLPTPGTSPASSATLFLPLNLSQCGSHLDNLWAWHSE